MHSRLHMFSYNSFKCSQGILRFHEQGSLSLVFFLHRVGLVLLSCSSKRTAAEGLWTLDSGP